MFHLRRDAEGATLVALAMLCVCSGVLFKLARARDGGFDGGAALASSCTSASRSIAMPLRAGGVAGLAGGGKSERR